MKDERELDIQSEMARAQPLRQERAYLLDSFCYRKKASVAGAGKAQQAAQDKRGGAGGSCRVGLCKAFAFFFLSKISSRGMT